MTDKMNRYAQIIESIFLSKLKPNCREILFSRKDIETASLALHVKTPKNLGDVLYSFRYRTELPESILKEAPEGKEWIIRPAGRAQYKFVLVSQAKIEPSELLVEIKIPDSTPGPIAAQFIERDLICLFEFVFYKGDVKIAQEKHYRLVPPDEVTTDDVFSYRNLSA